MVSDTIEVMQKLFQVKPVNFGTEKSLDYVRISVRISALASDLDRKNHLYDLHNDQYRSRSTIWGIRTGFMTNMLHRTPLREPEKL